MKHFLFCFLFLLIVGCATPYQARNAAGGYYEVWYSERQAWISFSGNGFTTSDVASLYAAIRASELALSNGFSHFIILRTEHGGMRRSAQITPDQIIINPNDSSGITVTEHRGTIVTSFHPTSQFVVYFIKEHEMEIALSRGYNLVPARLFIERNAPDNIRTRILSHL